MDKLKIVLASLLLVSAWITFSEPEPPKKGLESSYTRTDSTLSAYGE